MRRLAVVAATALLMLPFAVAARAETPAKPVVELLTTADEVSQQDLLNGLPAFQTMVSRDLAPIWGADATLIVGDPAHPQPADMTLTVSDSLGCWFCAGFHSVTANGQPYAFVTAGLGDDWTLILTHELEEMLVDPTCKRFELGNGRMWVTEVADPVESGFYAYWIGNVAISDFITPDWYSVTAKGPYDFAGFLTKPMQLGRYGYASYRDDGGWHFINRR